MGAIILSTLEASMLTDSQPIQTQSSWQGSVFGTLFGSCELFLLPDIGLWLLPGAKNFEFLYFLLFFCQTQAASATGWSMYFFLILFSINFFYNLFCRHRLLVLPGGQFLPQTLLRLHHTPTGHLCNASKIVCK